MTAAAVVFNGLAFGMLLFLVAGGMTVIFGLLRVVNLAHGALYLVGAAVGVAAHQAVDNFAVALAAGALAAGVVALVMDQILARYLYGQPVNQLLVTLGVGFILADAVLAWRGGIPEVLPAPSVLSGSATLPGGLTFPTYRLALIVFGLVYAAALAWLWQRSSLGATLRAAVDDAETLEAHGVRVSRLFTATFVTGAAIAGAAGVVGGPFLGVYTGLDFDILLVSVVIVVIGGLGSLGGAFAASMVVGLIDAAGKTWIPELSYFLLFGPVLLLLATRPEGLFGRRLA